jgi:nucleoid-associated protein YgaU
MALEKLTLFVETQVGVFSRVVKVLFNPGQISLDKTVQWKPLPVAERDAVQAGFTHGNATTLTMDLFFDSYEEGVDVQLFTKPVQEMVQVQGELHRPPRCQLQWGLYDFGGFQWVVTKMTQRFSLFFDNGLPARASLSCTFQQWRSGEEEARETAKSSPDVAKTRVVRRGETLSSIAAQEYNDPALWRPIAAANGIDNPRRLEPGRTLAIPALQPGRRA